MNCKKLVRMRKITILFFIFFRFSSFAQDLQDQEMLKKPYITFKNGIHFGVSRPIVVCDSMCYFINRSNKKVFAEPISNIEGFSQGNDVRWITYEEFHKIGTRPIRGYLFGFLTMYPTGFGIFIMSDITKRKHIKKIFRDTRIN